jgi:ribonucleoside-diphosphate reductase alpha chain
LPHTDHTYKQAPFEDCSPEKYQVLIDSLQDFDVASIVEIEDNTNLSGELACSGGACEII